MKFICIGKDKVIACQILPATFQIFLYGEWENATNNFAYTDITDCLDDAIKLIRFFKPDLIKWFNTVQESYESALINLDKKGDIIEGLNTSPSL